MAPIAGVAPIAQGDLDIDFVIRTIDASRIIDKIGIDTSIGPRIFDPAKLGDGEIGALTNNFGFEVGRIDTNIVVGTDRRSAHGFRRAL